MQKYFEKIKERLKGLDWVFATYYPDGTEVNKQSRKSVAYDDVIEIVNQVAEEYSNSEIPNKLLDSLHTKILKSKFAEEVTEAEIEALVKAKMNMSEKPTSSNEFCEWKIDGVYLHCQHDMKIVISCLEDEEYRYNFCPYCGKEIKVVE